MTDRLGPLSDKQLAEFDEWAAARKSRPASRGMIWALGLRATLAERDAAVLHEAARAIRNLPTAGAGYVLGDEALNEREGIASFLEDWATEYSPSR